ncbi:cysteine desulfurase family protein [Piscinibacter defluvii]|uniref:cysteine desulfurase family protein n=1 Tax=Piscinibacter defluvii TaxID=1796922 RepID=UPI000FDE3318|nr:cysteine desulfurase family protein [Piscinibacter defluvii]
MTVYLDHNATTPPLPAVLQAMAQVQAEHWANPSSTHVPGQAARQAMAQARARIAAFLGCKPAELVLGSGATEANHHAVLGALQSRAGEGRRRWLLSAVEHPGLMALAAHLQQQGVPVTRVPVDGTGRLDLAALRAALGPDVALLSLMGANNETGVCMPLAEAVALCDAAGAWLHVDATQLIGKSPFRFAGSGIDLLSASAHKLNGPKGVGTLVVRQGLALPALLHGRQERQRRGGTENLAGIAGFAAACDAHAADLPHELERLARLRDRLEVALLDALPGVHVVGRAAPRVPNTLCLRFAELDADPVLTRLERAGVVASSGAACSAGGTQPSHVLLAMGESPAHARGGIRFSLGRTTTEAHIDTAIAAIVRALAPLLEPTASLESAA